MFEKLKQIVQPRQRDIFSRISGHEDVKLLLRGSLRADKPVHVLLQGPPGTAKTAHLKAIEAQYPEISLLVSANGCLTTGSGLADELFSHPSLRYILIDELENFSKKDQSMLYELMQSGRLIETKIKTGRREILMNVTIFATCNSTKKILAPLTDRFIIKKIVAYDETTFVNICIERLPCEPLLARFIATRLWDSDRRSIRMAENIAAMCHDEAAVLDILRVTKDE